MRAQELLSEGLRALQAGGIEGAVRDARWLMAYALGVTPDRLILSLADPVGPEQQHRFRTAITARLSLQPVAQITGERLFWGRRFKVTPDVLDPRPETESLIAAALEYRFSRVLDLGTGSGAILLSLLAERVTATGLGVDLSPAALGVAQENAKALGLDRRARFALSDWFDAVEGVFDLVVSNPPYIANTEIEALAPETRDWEPRMALVPAGCDGSGLAAYRRILAGLHGFLAPRGRVIVEVGLGQGSDVAALFAQAGLTGVRLGDDMTGRARIVQAEWPG